MSFEAIWINGLSGENEHKSPEEQLISLTAYGAHSSKWLISVNSSNWCCDMWLWIVIQFNWNSILCSSLVRDDKEKSKWNRFQKKLIPLERLFVFRIIRRNSVWNLHLRFSYSINCWCAINFSYNIQFISSCSTLKDSISLASKFNFDTY